MRLLSPEEVADKRDMADADRVARIQVMSQEESDIVKRLNIARALEKEENGRIEKERKEAREKADIEIKTIGAEISSRRQERADLMRPIHDIRKEAEQKLTDADKAQEEVKLAREALEKGSQALAERMEAIVDREKSAEEKDIELDSRERKIEVREKELAASERELGDKWAAYHIAINEANKSLETREKSIKAAQIANETVRKSLEEDAARNASDRKGIKDGYATLERTRIELGTGKRPNQ
jgi:hypothetical protein